jgi:hypothetical protein
MAPQYTPLPLQVSNPNPPTIVQWVFLELVKIARALAAPNFELVQLSAMTVAALPTPVGGRVAYVSDGAAGLSWGATVTEGGTTSYLVWANGTNWTVVGS